MAEHRSVVRLPIRQMRYDGWEVFITWHLRVYRPMEEEIRVVLERDKPPTRGLFVIPSGNGLLQMLQAGQFGIAADWLDDHPGLVRAGYGLTCEKTLALLGEQYCQDQIAEVWRHGFDPVAAKQAQRRKEMDEFCARLKQHARTIMRERQ